MNGWTRRRVRGVDWSMRIDEVGDGPATYILVHGYGAGSWYLRPTAELLAADARVLMPTMPGWRGSKRAVGHRGVGELADVVAEWMRSDHIADAVVIANSFGCQVAAELAARHPRLVAALVLTGPTVEPTARTFRRMMARLAIDTVREPLSLWGILAVDYAAFGPMRWVRTGRAALAHRLEDVLPMVEAPVLVVRGSRDGLVTREWAAQCAALARDGVLAEIHGVGHAVNYNAPQRLAALVTAFAASTAERTQMTRR